MSLPSADAMYKAIAERNRDFVGVFFVAVKTTGVFCLPGCPARTPLRKNVEFFARAADALYAGYRPCKVCRPMDAGEMPPAWIEPVLKAIEGKPTERLKDRDIRALGIAPERARRWFKSRYGMTFQGYHRARRMGLALKTIRNGGDRVDAAIETGYDSDSGFRDAFEKILGAPLSRASSLEPMQAKWIETPLGPILAAANDEGLCLLEFVDRRMLPVQIERLRKLFGCAVVPGPNPFLDGIENELALYFRGELHAFHTPLVLKGSEFQVKVWKRLLEIPYGETLSYGQMALDIGVKDAQRAVGRANGDNRLAIIIPCHRVIRSDGTLCGYGGGLWRKKRLLELEQGVHTLL
jgi:AraC family transcriptional regulator of adaptative response/methylated-DNA-[protein]-cysteine methyltransferase